MPAGVPASMLGDVCPLGRDIIHSVITGPIRIHGGDFETRQREQREPETLHIVRLIGRMRGRGSLMRTT